jgi:trimeric autotransporter adhesin
MSIDTTKAMNYSWMSQASYLDLTAVIPGSATSLQGYLRLKALNEANVFAENQARTFTDPSTGYSFINQLANTTNGTSATVFKSNKDGSYTIAVRGTEPTAQLGTDLLQDIIGVVAAGKAKVQLIEAFRYYKQLTTAAGQAVTYSDTEVNMMSSVLLSGTPLTGGLESLAAAKSAFAAMTADDQGLGLIPAGATINFAGHSLGGHVAYLLADLVAATSGGAHPLGDVMTYNAPGENALLYELQNWLGIDTSSQAGSIGSKHLAFYGEGGINVTAGLGQVIGTRVPLFIENGGVVAGNIAMENHSIVKLSDSLAVYNLLQKLDPNLTSSAIDSLLKAGTATDADSLEQTLDVVRKTILGTGLSPTKAAGSADSQTSREAFYSNLYGLIAAPQFVALAGSVRLESLLGKTADGLASLAKTSADALAYRYALKEGNPFALVGAANLYDKFNTAGELNRYDPATGTGELTDQWLKDRSAYLTWLTKANTADKFTLDGSTSGYTGDRNWEFTDLTKNQTITVKGRALGFESTAPANKVIFGSDGNDTYFSGDQADYLYGGAGMDRLDGGKGNDYIEGNVGSDTLSGGEGQDTLLGGTGMDILEGGKDNDLLNGGLGDDTYKFTSGDGWDWIEDQDGLGHIEYDGLTLKGGKAVGDSGMVWQETVGSTTFTYLLTDWTENGETFKRLSIQGPDGGMWVKGWRAGQLGLALDGVAPPPITATLLTAGPDNIHPIDASGPVIDGLAGNDLLVSYQQAVTLKGGLDNDLLFGGAGDDRLEGGDGNDLLNGGAGHDVILGGDGNDFVSGGNLQDLDLTTLGPWADVASRWTWSRNDTLSYEGNSDALTIGATATLDGQPLRFTQPANLDAQDTSQGDVVFGGAGHDVLAGSEGSDTLSGEADDDVLFGNGGADNLQGGDGNDQIVGGAGMDNLEGGLGKDTLVGGYEDDTLNGGAGDDILFGDLPNLAATNAPPAAVDLTRSGKDTLYGGDGNDTLYGGGNNDTLYGGDGIDQLYGGAQADELHGGAGDDRLEGDSGTAPAADQGDDTLYGDAGDDVLIGAGGADTLDGGDGNDQLYGDADNVPAALQSNDILRGGAGNDYLRGYGGNDTLDGGTGDDELHGSEGDDTLAGGTGNNQLLGEEGNDTLTATGADFLSGGAGDDTYIIDTSNATILDLSGNNRINLLRAVTMSDVTITTVIQGLALTYGSNTLLLKDAASGTLPTVVAADGSAFDGAAITAHISKNLTGAAGTDTLTGGIGNDTLFGLAGDDTLIGGEGNDFLDGGADFNTVIGGQGNDTYRIAYGQWGWGNLSMNDTVVEAAGEGTDTIIAYSYNAFLPDNVENLKLAPIDWSYASGNTPRRGTGNSSDNVLDASGYTNMPSWVELDGREGQDVMIGADDGNTTFYVDNAGDQVIASGTSNTVRSTIEYTLGATIRDLILEGATPINGGGNDQDNRLDGLQNSAANRLSGGRGNDYYILGAGDVAIENAGEGNDTVRLEAGDVGVYRSSEDFLNIENIVFGLGLGASDLIGDDNNNVLTGNAYNNRLVGGGGNDTLVSNGDGSYVYVEGSTYEVTWGNDTLDGGSGDDALIGCKGNETYLFGRGYGTDFISDVGGLDTIRFGDGVASTDILLSRQDNDLRIAIAGSEDTLTVRNHFAVPPTWDVQYTIDQMEFSDGVVWDLSAINARLAAGNVNTLSEVSDVIIGSTGADIINALGGDDNVSGLDGDDFIDGGSGNDQLFGNAGNDTLNGGAGKDTLDGGTGNDTYLFGIGSGQDSISVLGNQARARSVNVVQFLAGISPANVQAVSYAEYGSGLLNLFIGDGSDQLSIEGFFSPDCAEYISEFRFDDGTVWSHDDVDTMSRSVFGTADDDVLSGNESSNLLFGLAGNDSLSGGGGNDVLNGGVGTDTMYGGAGNDTYVVDSVGDVVVENLNEGTDLVQSNVTYTLVANVENLTLTDTAAINGAGNSLNNVLTGNSAANILNGGTGSDTMLGGAGDDTYVVDNTADVVTENVGEGTDLVQASVTYALAANVENLKLTGTAAINGTGNALDNVLIGNSTINTLTGGAGNDTLDGGAGADNLIGGVGNDSYIVDNTGDVITENANEGTDLVQSSVTTTLAANVENLTLTGTATVNGIGNTLNNFITGNSANNMLDGGAGADTLAGGAGNDTYVVDDTGDVVTEAASAGTDLVQSSLTYSLAANVENLTLTGSAAINGTGNSLGNTLTGNSADNVLDGGTGVDTLIGGLGNDTYVVDNVGDTVTEGASAGTDLVQSSVTYTLGANVENLTMTGTSAITGTGNALDNVLKGNSAANTLVGGAGNDTYYVSTGDTVTEATSAGTDTVIADVTWTLGSNLENLTLGGTAAINGTGNTLSNMLTGNAGNNTLNGGTGADTMIGGAGNDTYVVDATGDVVTEAANEGIDFVHSGVTYTLSANAENLTLTGTAAINGTGNALDNVLIGNSANNTLTGGAGNDTLDGGLGNDTLVGGLGDDTYVVNVSTDVVTEAANAGNDIVQSAVTLTLTTNVENLILTGTAAINGTGNTLNNLVRGNGAVNTLNGGTGNDVLEGGAGNDILTDTSGTALFNGGVGSDTMTGGAGAEIYLGGLGNDTYTTGASNDVVLFNKGDGQDTFAAGGTGSDTVSLGGGIAYGDLSFSKATNDLVLKVGTTDQITFKNWYATTPSKPVLNLQVVAEAMADFAAGGSDPLRDQKVEEFNFAGLVRAFDTARAANTGLTSWALTNALVNFQLAGSDSAALGGDLAYQYGKNGTLAGIGITPALDVLSSAALGTSAQALTPLAGLQTGTQRLS